MVGEKKDFCGMRSMGFFESPQHLFGSKTNNNKMQISIEHLKGCIYNCICCQIKGRKKYLFEIIYLSPGFAFQRNGALALPVESRKTQVPRSLVRKTRKMVLFVQVELEVVIKKNVSQEQKKPYTKKSTKCAIPKWCAMPGPWQFLLRNLGAWIVVSLPIAPPTANNEV